MDARKVTPKFTAAPNTGSLSLPKLKLEVAGTGPGQADDVVAAITEGSLTGRIGDGKIFVIDLEQALRVRTGETRSDNAL